VLGPSRLGALAQIQLAAWEAIAVDWPVYADHDTGRLRCASCHGAVLTLVDDRGGFYHWSEDQVLAAKVTHLRARHPSLDPDR
jgi:hypothetical protein